MSSFERQGSTPEEEIELPKFPIKRLTPSVQKFCKVLQMDLDRLNRHKLNVEKVLKKF